MSMRAGDVWRFPTSSPAQHAFLRVVCRVQDLGLPRRSPLAFVEGCVWCEVSRSSDLHAESFSPPNLSLSCAFLVPTRDIRALGYERVAARVCAQPSALEPACWFVHVSRGREAAVAFCRGELRYETDLSARVVEGWRRPALTLFFPAQLSDCIAADRNITSRGAFMDARSHPKRAEFPLPVQNAMEGKYWEQLPRERRGAYESALRNARRGR